MKTVFIQFLKLLAKADDAAAKLPWAAVFASKNPWLIGAKIGLTVIGTMADLFLISIIVPTDTVKKVNGKLLRKEGDWGIKEYYTGKERRNKRLINMAKRKMVDIKKRRDEIINGGAE